MCELVEWYQNQRRKSSYRVCQGGIRGRYLTDLNLEVKGCIRHIDRYKKIDICLNDQLFYKEVTMENLIVLTAFLLLLLAVMIIEGRRPKMTSSKMSLLIAGALVAILVISVSGAVGLLILSGTYLAGVVVLFLLIA